MTEKDDAISFIYDHRLPNTMNRCSTSKRRTDEHLIFVQWCGTTLLRSQTDTCVIVAIAACAAERDAHLGEVPASFRSSEKLVILTAQVAGWPSDLNIQRWEADEKTSCLVPNLEECIGEFPINYRCYATFVNKIPRTTIT